MDVRAYVARYTEHAVYLVSRPRGLPAGYDPAAEGHARALEEIADHLVLTNSACRLDEGARDDVQEFERDARERD